MFTKRAESIPSRVETEKVKLPNPLVNTVLVEDVFTSE